MKKIVAVLLCVTLLAGCLFGCASAPSSAPLSSGSASGSDAQSAAPATKPERVKIKIAYHPHITGLGAVLNAQEKGYFEEENLEVEFIQFTSGATELAAMASGEIDFGYLGVGAHVFAPQGQCAILALDSTDLSGEILVRADSGIKTMADLKGKNIAISAGTTSELVLSMALKLNGMEKTDVNMVNMDAAGKVTSFMSNQIDAISIESPYTDQIRKDMGADKVVTLSGSKDFLPDAVFTNSWVTTNTYLEKNPEVVVRFLKAYLRGVQDRYDAMDETVQQVATYINTDYETAALVVEKTNWLSNSDLKKLVDDGTLYQWYGTMKDMFLDAGLLEEQYNVPAEDFVKLDSLNQAMKELNIP